MKITGVNMSLNNIKRVYVDSDEDTIWISKSILHKMIDKCYDNDDTKEVTVNLELSVKRA